MKKQWIRIDAVKVRVLLYQKNMTQTELANKIGMSRATVNAILNGKSCKSNTAHKIAEGLDVSIEKIMEEDDGL